VKNKKFLENGEPTLLLDRETCMANISRMAEKAGRHNVRLRPHFKTHQSIEIGSWFRQSGCTCITVSSLRMAEYFAAGGWKDITVAFPANIHETDKINRLAGSISLNLVAESAETVSLLSQSAAHRTGLYIKVDTGYHRTGVDVKDFGSLDRIVESVSCSENMVFKGFLAHAGHSYHVSGPDEVMKVHRQTLSCVSSLAARYGSACPDMEISIGDTPCCSIAEDFAGVTEIRPGNYVFYDLMQMNIGSCRFSDIAVAMAVPVVAKHRERSQVIVYGGGVHFSKEHIQADDGTPVYGQMAEFRGDRWEEPEHRSYLTSLSQEHGIIQADPAEFDSLNVGDVIPVLPVHSCLTANLSGFYRTLDGNIIDRHFR